MGKKTRGTARDTLFTATGPVLLRTPALARPHRHAAGPGEEGSSAYLAGAAADPVLREAIEVSSPSLADVLDQATGAAPHPAATHPAAVRPAAADRAAEAVGRYRLRMATRPTPFGLMAAVATGRFDTRAKVRWDGAERRTFRPDLGWLLPLLDGLRTEPPVLARLRLAADQQVTERGDRLVLPYLPERGSTTGDTDAQPVTERSVRATAVVRAALRHAARPLRHPDLLAALAADFPAAPAEAIAGLVRTLVAQGFLLTDLTPPSDSTDLLGHVLERLPDGHPVRAELATVRDLLAQASASPRGQATAALREARQRMTRLRPTDRPLHADLALDAEVVLPEQVRTELEHTATVLWRLSPPATAPEHLRAYHAEFVERYGTDSPVPLAELLDPDTGLGPPAGYRRPAGARGAANPQPARARTDAEAARDRLLAELAAGALADREPGGPLPEVVLDDDLLGRLVHPQEPDGGGADTPPASMELYAELAADSLDALDDGRFRLVLSPTAGSDRAGATFGRFAAQLGGGALLAAAAGLDDSGLLDDGELIHAHLEFTPYRARHANIALTPRWLDHRVSVSAFPEDGGPAVIPLDDLVVLADTERLSVHSRSLGREIRATAHHALNLRTGAPNAARFLQEVALTGQRPWQPWDWGATAGAPALPRVRRGRVVLAPAAWRLTDPVPSADSPYEQWVDGLARWRRRWGVPAAVRLLSGDQRIGLDLDDPWHRRLLHSQAHSGRPTVLQEDLAGDHTGDLAGGGGWLRGHVTELVVPLRRTARPAASPARRPLPAAHPRMPELPGGPWLFARIAATEARHDEILADHLPRLLAALPGAVDRWFFIRYRDPAPHLRLRFHGAPPALAASLLPALHDWAHDLRRAGLAADLRLEGYAPETDRYGGPDALAHAERVFHADSLVALQTLRLARAARTAPGELLAAVNLTGTARDFLAARASAPTLGAWIAATYPKSEEHHRAFRTHRAAALRAIGPDGPATPGGGLLPADPALTAAWQERAARLAEYAAHLAPDAAGPALASLLHMGHNRLIGIDREAERRAYALARGALEAHRTRPTATEESR